MTESEDQADAEELDGQEALEAMALAVGYKVLGQTSDSDKAGVLGQNNASGGTPIGVEGSVPNADGYGLATQDDAKIEGQLIASPIALPPYDTVGDNPRRVRDALGALFNESAWAKPRYTSGPSHGEGDNAFWGATLAPSGEVVFAPSDSNNVGVVETNAQTVRPRVTALHPLVNNS